MPLDQADLSWLHRILPLIVVAAAVAVVVASAFCHASTFLSRLWPDDDDSDTHRRVAPFPSAVDLRAARARRRLADRAGSPHAHVYELRTTDNGMGLRDVITADERLAGYRQVIVPKDAA